MVRVVWGKEAEAANLNYISMRRSLADLQRCETFHVLLSPQRNQTDDCGVRFRRKWRFTRSISWSESAGIFLQNCVAGGRCGQRFVMPPLGYFLLLAG